MRLFFFLFVFLVGCQDLNSNSSDKTKFGESNLVGTATFKEAYAIINDRCINCHTGYHNSWSAITREIDWRTAAGIIPGDPDGSNFIQRIQNYSNDNSSNMPLGLDPLEDEDYEKLREWITDL